MRYALIFTFLLAANPTTVTAAEADNEARLRDAVNRGLKFLASQQKKSGAWDLRGRGESPGITSLAVMAFVSAGHVPGEGPYGDNLNRAIDWIVVRTATVSKKKGEESVLIKGGYTFATMYEHGIATMMLAEVVNKLSKERADAVRKTLTQAVQLILDAQRIPKRANNAGGWRYSHESRDSDLTVTGWQISALKAAELAGMEVPEGVFEDAAAYVLKTAHPRTGGFGYQPRSTPTETRCAVGILSLMLCGKHKSPEIENAVKFMRRRPRFRSYPLYGFYHRTAAFRKIGGDGWTGQRKLAHETFLKSQGKNGDWSRVSPRSQRFGPAYMSALALLTLTLERGHLAVHRR